VKEQQAFRAAMLAKAIAEQEELDKANEQKNQKKGTDYGDDIPVIFSYTRQQAIEDGVLVDVTETAREAGFKHPTVVTEALWVTIQTIPKGFDWESPSGRLWDVLWMAVCEGRRQGGKSRITYKLVLHSGSDNPDVDHIDSERQRMTELVCDCGPDDLGRPCITIGYSEDF